MPAPDRPGTSGTGVAGADLVELARAQIGDPYVWGAEGPDAFDCSGLMQWVYKQYKIGLPRVTGDQVRVGVEVPRNQIQAGDLIFSSWDGKPHSHVGMATGTGTIITAPGTGKRVHEVPLNANYLAHVDGVRRVPGVVGGPATGTPLPVGGSGGTPATGVSFPTPGGLLVPLLPFPNPASVTQGLANVGNGIAGMATSLLSVGKVADAVLKLMLPNNLVRAAAGIGGTVFILAGVWQISRELRQ